MALFRIKTPQELRDDWDAEIRANFPGAKPTLLISFFRILGRGVALLMHGLYIFMFNSSLDIFVTTASKDKLDTHGSEWGVTRIPAGAAVGNVTATGSNGSVIPLGTRLKSGLDILYETTALATISGASAIVPVQAITFGLNTAQAAGTALTFLSPVAGVGTETLVDSSGLIGGADKESDDDYRKRILFEKRNPLQCGSPNDYVIWAKRVPDVTRVFVKPREDGLGTVNVRFMMDNKFADGIPQAADVAAVQALIDTLAPAQVLVTVSAPIAQPENFSIALTPNTGTVQASVDAALLDLLIRESIPGGTLLISKVRQTVSNAVGEDDNTVNIPSANLVAASVAHIITLGTTSYP